MKRFLLATNGSGYQIEKCLAVEFFRQSIDVIVSDRNCPALEVAQRHGIDQINLNEKDSIALNDQILKHALDRGIDYIISPGFTRVFRGEILQRFHNRIFNCHPSILPGFRGFYDTRDTNRRYHARKIFERVIDFGSRVTGNTIHTVTENIDEGFPVIVSTMNIPYEEDVKVTRHRLFVQECKCLLQLVSWLNEERIKFDSENRVSVTNAEFDAPFFSPNIDTPEVLRFELDYPVLNQTSSFIDRTEVNLQPASANADR